MYVQIKLSTLFVRTTHSYSEAYNIKHKRNSGEVEISQKIMQHVETKCFRPEGRK